MVVPPHAAGRFEFVRLVSSGEHGIVWIARDSETGLEVVARAVSPDEGRRLEGLIGFKNRHLAGILSVVSDFAAESLPPSAPRSAAQTVAIAEFIPGTSLAEHLQTTRVLPAKAVAWTARLIELLQLLHARGTPLGHLSPYSLLAKPAGRAIAPVVTQLLFPPLAACCSLNRVLGSAPSEDDDIWGLACSLYAALTGKLPFTGTTPSDLRLALERGNVKSLASEGVNEVTLDLILKRALSTRDSERITRLEDLAQMLDDWERDPEQPPRLPVVTARPPRRAVRAVIREATELVFNPDTLEARVSYLPGEGSQFRSTSTPPPPGAVTFVRAASVPPSAPNNTLPPGSSPVNAPSSPQGRSRPSLTPSRAAAHLTPIPGIPPKSSPGSSPLASGSAIRDLARGSTPPPQPKPHKLMEAFQDNPSRWPWLALVTALVGVGSVFAWHALRHEEASATTPERAAVSASPPASVAPPRVEPSKNLVEDRDSCIVALFKTRPKPQPNLGFVCGDGDFRGIALRLHKLFGGQTNLPLPEDPDAAPIKAAPEPGGYLGWYELPTTAVIRQTCCGGSTPIALPKSSGSCDQLGDIVNLIAQSLASEEDLAAAANRFDLAVSCLFARRGNGGYAYRTQPTAQSRKAFLAFLERARASYRPPAR